MATFQKLSTLTMNTYSTMVMMQDSTRAMPKGILSPIKNLCLHESCYSVCMKFFSLQRPSFIWGLLFSLMTHFFVAHHDGGVTLTLSQHADHQLVLESSLEHAITHHSESEDHHDSEQGHEHELHLEHPEWYNFQASNSTIESLNLRLAYVPIRLATFNIFESFFEPGSLEHSYFERHFPPKEQVLVLNSTILLI